MLRPPADVFSGAVLLAEDGVVVYKGSVGTANKDYSVPNKIDKKFNLGSMNKMFTAGAIAQLVEKGTLSPDDPLFKFIPNFPDADSDSAKKSRSNASSDESIRSRNISISSKLNAGKSRRRSQEIPGSR